MQRPTYSGVCKRQQVARRKQHLKYTFSSSDCEDDLTVTKAVPSDVGQPGQGPFTPAQSDFIELEFGDLYFVYYVTAQTTGTFTVEYKDTAGVWVPYEGKIDLEDAPNGEVSTIKTRV